MAEEKSSDYVYSSEELKLDWNPTKNCEEENLTELVRIVEEALFNIIEIIVARESAANEENFADFSEFGDFQDASPQYDAFPLSTAPIDVFDNATNTIINSQENATDEKTSEPTNKPTIDNPSIISSATKLSTTFISGFQNMFNRQPTSSSSSSNNARNIEINEEKEDFSKIGPGRGIGSGSIPATRRGIISGLLFQYNKSANINTSYNPTSYLMKSSDEKFYIEIMNDDAEKVQYILDKARNKYLLMNEFKPPYQQETTTALILATKFSRQNVAKVLIDAGADLNLTDEEGNTALIWATIYGDIASIQLLLSRGAYIDTQNREGQTALFKAVLNGNLIATKLLISFQTDITMNHQDKKGRTVLMIAAMNGHMELVQLLVESDADPSILDHERKTALSYAIKIRNSEITNFLKFYKVMKHKKQPIINLTREEIPRVPTK
jgi:uncharacterized protein